MGRVKLDTFLVRDYLVKILSEGDEFVQEFYGDLVKKSRIFSNMLSKERIPSLKERDAEILLKLSFPSRRKADRIIKETGLQRLKEALFRLIHTEGDWESKIENFYKNVRGIDRKATRDLGSEILHFTFPDKFILWTGWIWDPETETGAIVFLKEEPPIGGKGREMYGQTYDEFKEVYLQIYHILEEFGVKVRGFLFVDMFLAMIYATYVDYMTLSTMHSAKGFFPPAGIMARRLLGVHEPSLLNMEV